MPKPQEPKEQLIDIIDKKPFEEAAEAIAAQAHDLVKTFYYLALTFIEHDDKKTALVFAHMVKLFTTKPPEDPTDFFTNFAKALRERRKVNPRIRTDYHLMYFLTCNAYYRSGNPIQYADFMYYLIRDDKYYTGLGTRLYYNICKDKLDETTFQNDVQPKYQFLKDMWGVSLQADLQRLYPNTTFENEIWDELLHIDCVTLTLDYLPQIHPMWTSLAALDPYKLVEFITQQNPKEKRLFVVVAAAVLPQVDLLGFLANHQFFTTALAVKDCNLLKQAFKRKIDSTLENHEHTADEILEKLLSIPSGHSFLSKVISRCSEKTSDLSSVTDFTSLCSLYRATHRFDIFQKAAETMETEYHRLKLSKSILYDFDFGEPTTSEEDFLQSILAEYPEFTKLDELLGFEDELKTPTSLGTFKSWAEQIIESKIPHRRLFLELCLKKGYSCLDSSFTPIIKACPNVMKLAAALPQFGENLVVELFKRFDTLNDIEISDEELTNQFGHILEAVRSKKHEVTIMKMVKRIDPEVKRTVVLEHITKFLEDEHHSHNGNDVCGQLIRQDSQLGPLALHLIMDKKEMASSSYALKTVRDWIFDCWRSNGCKASEINDAVFMFVNVEYPAVSSGKRKAELAMKWALNALSQLPEGIDRERYSVLTAKITEAGSRDAATMLRKIINGTK